jgi:hypothetical protein
MERLMDIFGFLDFQMMYIFNGFCERNPPESLVQERNQTKIIHQNTKITT